MSIQTLQRALTLPHIRSYIDDSKKYVYKSEQRTLLRKMAAKLLGSPERDHISTLDYERLRVALNQMLNIGELEHRPGSQTFDKVEVQPLQTNDFRPAVVQYCNKVVEESVRKLAEFKASTDFQPGDMVINREGVLYKATGAGTTEEIGVVKKSPQFKFAKEERYGTVPLPPKDGLYRAFIRNSEGTASLCVSDYNEADVVPATKLEDDKYDIYDWAKKNCNVSLQDLYLGWPGQPYQEQVLQRGSKTGMSNRHITMKQLRSLLDSAPSKEARDQLKRQFYAAMYSGDPSQFATQTVNLSQLQGETTMKPITLTTKTYINDEHVPLEDMPKDKVYDLIKSHEAKIESLEKIKSKPAALKAEIEAYQNGIDTLVQWLDANKKP